MRLGKIATNIGYSGVVDIKKQFNGNLNILTTHNSGTNALFKSLAKALAGYSIKNEIPSAIRIIDDEGNSILSRGSVPLSGGVYDLEGDTWKTSYSFSLTSNDIVGTIIDGTEYRLQMLSNNNDILAETIIDGDNLNISKQMSLVVKWDMILSNKG